MDSSAPVVLILGMHRSGTSCLAGALERCGLFLGEVRRTGRFNARGYFELASLVRLHDEILAANRGAWYDLPNRIDVSERHRRQLQRLAGFYARFRPSGLKDPRMTVLLHAWESLAVPVRLVASFRHPVAVARSLASRNRMSEAHALTLWQQYNSALVTRHQQDGFPLIAYDLRSPQAYVQNAAAVASSLGLSPDREAIESFVSDDLDHQGAADAPVPPSCRDTYEYLLAHRLDHAGTPDRPGAVRSAAVRRDGRPAVPDQPPGLLPRAREWSRRRLRSTIHGLARTRFTARARRSSLDRVTRLVLFVGNARSGTTLVRSALDAHPNVVLGNEVNVLERFSDGEEWATVAGRILASADRFRRTPAWEGYAYDIRRSEPASTVLVIGDKKAAASARALMSDVWMLDRVAEWSSLPVHIVHCVRNPFDVITTKTLRNGRSLRRNMARYFETEQTAAFVHDDVGPRQFTRIYLEDLIADPDAALRALVTGLGLSVDQRYVDNCKSVIFDRPSTTRDKQPWSAADTADVLRQAAHIPHLSRYVTTERERS